MFTKAQRFVVPLLIILTFAFVLWLLYDMARREMEPYLIDTTGKRIHLPPVPFDRELPESMRDALDGSTLGIKVHIEDGRLRGQVPAAHLHAEMASRDCEAWAIPLRLKNNHIYYWNEQGKLIADVEGYWGYPFTEGLACIATEADPTAGATTWGYINMQGEWVIPGQFPRALPFHEGMAAAQREDGLWGYIDPSGTWVIPPRFAHAQSFSSGLAPVYDPVQKGFGYIDKSGTFKIAPEFGLANEFSEGYASVRRDTRTSCIDTTGKEIFNVPFYEVGPFKDGLAVAGDVERGYIRLDGTWAIAPQFRHAMPFRNGYAVVIGTPRYKPLIDLLPHNWAEQLYEWGL